MVLRPVSEAQLEECDTRVVVVTLGEISIELLGKPLELRVRPIGIIGRSITACVLLEGLFVVLHVLDILWHSRATRYTIDLCVARILVAETDDTLVVA